MFIFFVISDFGNKFKIERDTLRKAKLQRTRYISLGYEVTEVVQE
jgi:hypothetical protein